MFDDGVEVIAGIPKTKHRPVAWGRRTRGLIPVGIATDGVIPNGREGDLIVDGTHSSESAVDIEVGIVAELDHHAGFDGQRRSLLHRDASQDSIGDVGVVPRATGGHLATTYLQPVSGVSQQLVAADGWERVHIAADGIPEAVLNGGIDNGGRSRLKVNGTVAIASILTSVSDDSVFDNGVDVIAGIPKTNHRPIAWGGSTR